MPETIKQYDLKQAASPPQLKKGIGQSLLYSAVHQAYIYGKIRHMP